MVRRKVPNKRGIPADHFKSSSSHHQDAKNRVSDLKKKMKKSSSSSSSSSSRSIKLSKPSFIQSDGSPNYMKSTSCFDARKERPDQVSSARNCQTNSADFSLSMSPVLRSSVSHSKTCSVERSSSLKLVRTLTKTPTFKPTRISLKKSQRATCSSTLKNYKAPPYLELDRVGTESDGSSTKKVCSYCYCSLNGHHHGHSGLPPLKCFISARRRLITTQKSIKLKAIDLFSSNEENGLTSSAAERFSKLTNFFFEEEYIENVVSEETEMDDTDDHHQINKIDEEHYVQEITEERVGFDEKAHVAVSEETETEMDNVDDHHEVTKIDEEDHVKEIIDESEGFEEKVHDYSKSDEDDTEEEMEECHGKVFDKDEKVEAESTEGTAIEEEEKTGAEKRQEEAGLDFIGADPEDEVSELITIPELKEKTFIQVDSSNAILQDGNSEPAEMVDFNPDTLHGFLAADSDRNYIEVTYFEDNKSSEADEGESKSFTMSGMISSADKSDSLENSLKEEAEKVIIRDKNSDSDSTGSMKAATLSRTSNGIKEDLQDRWDGVINPREPNYLPLVPEIDGEKVDLRHLMMDDKKNAEEWMLDFALQKAVMELAPARKRKVALLVQAFEAVTIPAYNCETQTRRAIDQPKPIQACF